MISRAAGQRDGRFHGGLLRRQRHVMARIDLLSALPTARWRVVGCADERRTCAHRGRRDGIEARRTRGRVR